MKIKYPLLFLAIFLGFVLVGLGAEFCDIMKDSTKSEDKSVEEVYQNMRG